MPPPDIEPIEHGGDTIDRILTRSPASAQRISYLTSAPGGVLRPLAEKLGETVSVTDFAGVDGQSKLLNALASGEKCILVPAGYQITIEAAASVPAGLMLKGEPGARITANGVNINALAVAGNDVTIEGLEIVACGTAGSFATFTGCGVYAAGVSNFRVRRVHVRNHRSWGVLTRNCTDAVIENCRFTTANVPASPDQDSTLGDIGVVENGADITISRNWIKSGLGNGVYIQTRQGIAGVMSGISVIDNDVQDSIGYGIFAYDRNVDFTVADTWRRLLIAGNRVFNILGSQDNSSSGKIYGAGIYVQGAGDIIVANNIVEKVCQQTKSGEEDNPTLAPAGIGVINCRHWTVIGNRVRDSRVFGYCYRNPNDYGIAGEQSLSIGNVSELAKWDGFKVTAIEDLTMDGDAAARSGRHNFNITGDTGGKGAYTLRGLRGDQAYTHLPISSVTGTFAAGETVTGGTSGATLTVIAVYSDRLVAKRITGTPAAEAWTGGTSGATATGSAPVLGAGFQTGTSSTPITFLDISDSNFSANDGVGLAIQAGAATTLSYTNVNTRNNKGIGTTIGSSIAVNTWAPGYSTGNSSQWSLSVSVGVLAASDADATLVATTPLTYRLSAALTAARAVTLPTNEPKGRRRRFVRAAGATGAFSWNIGSGPVVALTAEKQWAEAEFDGSTWLLVGYGTLP